MTTEVKIVQHKRFNKSFFFSKTMKVYFGTDNQKHIKCFRLQPQT